MSVNHGIQGLILAPVPKELTYTGGTFFPPKPLMDALAHYESMHGPVPGVDIIVGRDVSVTIDEPKARREGYELEIAAGGVTVRAHAQPGAFYALMTLRQILRQAVTGHPESGDSPGVPCLRIVDWPDFENRGIMLDISRDRVPTMETIHRLIDLWAELKINHVELYTEHTFAYLRHPTVWHSASPFTADEIRSLDRYCRSRHIELVPNQNSFGHMERWLAHPEYAEMAECPDGWIARDGLHRRPPFTLSPVVPETIPFLGGLYDELLPNFSSSQVNVGCDETFDLGQGKSAELCRANGVGRVYLDFLKKVHGLIRERKRTMLYWGDIIMDHPELVAEVPEDAIALTWGYEADHPFAAQCCALSAAGVKYYVCPGTSAWNSLGGRWENARKNIESAAENGLANGASGLLTTEWGDNGHLQQYPVALPGFVYGAALSWSTAESRDLPVSQVLSLHLFQDPSGHLAHALIALGSATDSLGVRLHNSTIAAIMLIDQDYPYYRTRYPEFAAADFGSCRTSIGNALQLALRAEPAADDGQLAVTEVVFTARLMLHACNLAEARLAGGQRETAELPVATRQQLAGELSPLIEEYRQLWNARSRAGGLSDSAGRLERLLDTYRG